MSDQEKPKKVYKYSKEVINMYNKKFKEKHSSEILICDQCFQSYSYLNKGYHHRSKRHQIAMQIRQTLLGVRVDPEKAGDIPSESKVA